MQQLDPPGGPGRAQEAALDQVRDYFAAWQAGDAQGCAAQWVYPAGEYAGGRWQVLADAEARRESIERDWRGLGQAGVTGGRVLELNAREAGPDAAWVEGRFSHEGAAGRVISETRASYLVVRTADGWRIAVAVLRG